jgi:hypothetical protein
LGALEISDTHSMSNIGVIDISKVGVIAFLPDDLHGSDDLVLVHQSVEAELGELFREIVGRNVN